ncbi:MAG: methyl-accepting chemotaxis protein, partial [Colwellia sp.]
WEKIDQAIIQLDNFSKNWTVKTNGERLARIKLLLSEFRTAQEEAEKLSHTPENILSYRILLTQAAPLASKIMTSITVLIEEEGTLEATSKRKELLKLLADSRGSFAIGLANIRAYLLSGDEKFKQTFVNKWKVNQQRFEQISTMSHLFSNAQKTAWNDYKENRKQFSSLPTLMFDSRASNDWNHANYILATKAAPKSKEIKAILTKMRASQNKLSKVDEQLLVDKNSTIKMVLLIVSILSAILGGFIAYKMSLSITSRLGSVMRRAKRIAEGDLSRPKLAVIGNDEITALTVSINEMDENLKVMVNEVSSSTENMASQSVQLKGVAEQMADTANLQARETEQVATGMNEMTATVAEVARNTANASEMAIIADNNVNKGKTLLEKNMSSINSLAKNIELATVSINTLGEDTKNVDSIIETISGIADQTNLLSLNAAIEAARAGEQGRGFAVVAGEIRTLASRTQESTIQIRSMLDGLKTSVDEVVIMMGEGKQQADSSVEKSKLVTDAFDKISESVVAINDMNAHIAEASNEQSGVCEELNQSIVRINSNAELAVSTSAHTNESSENVNVTAKLLQKLMSKFSLV